MSILIDKSTRLLVQGITGRDGLFHAKKMAEYGTNVVGGTSPGKGGTMIDDTFPVFNTMHEAVRRTQANTSVIFVPARFAADAIMEAADAGIRLIICITEGIPTLDVIKAYRFVELKGAKLIGPNCPGLISPGESLVGILPGQVFTPGNIGVISRSGTLTYEIVSPPIPMAVDCPIPSGSSDINSSAPAILAALMMLAIGLPGSVNSIFSFILPEKR
jgi:succinyl-CoA synthetase alpha subunit